MKNNNKKIYITLSVFAAVSLFLVVFFIWPLLAGIKKNSEDLISAKNSIVALSAQTKETENFRNSYAVYKPNLDKIEKMFVNPDNPVDFIKFLENTAFGSQMTLKISLPGSFQNSSDSIQDSIMFQLSSEGAFSKILNFTQKIETGPYLIEIESLNIQDSQKDNMPKDYLSRKVDAISTIKAFIKPR